MRRFRATQCPARQIITGFDSGIPFGQYVPPIAAEITDDNSRKRTRGESIDKSSRGESRVLVTVVIKRDAGRFNPGIRPPGFSDPNYHRASTMPWGGGGGGGTPGQKAKLPYLRTMTRNK